MQALIAAVVGIPILGAVASLAARNRAARPIAVVSTVLTAGTAVAIAAVMPKGVFVFGAMPWLGSSSPGFFGYQVDPLTNIMLLASTVIGAVIAVYSLGYLSPGNKEHASKEVYARYYFWLLLFVGAMAGIAVSPTLLQLLVFWEMTTLCSWALISFYNNDESLKAGMKALVMTSIGGLFFLGGLVWVLTATGTLRFGALGLMSPGARAAAFALFLIAAWAKSAQIPFHNWLPDAMAAPTPISAYLHAAAMVKAGVFLTARLLYAGWSVSYGMGMLISIAALVTMFAALYLFFFQDDLKRLLAYSTIAQLAYIFLGLGLGALGSTLAFRGAILHILMHAFAKTTLFLAVGAIGYAYGTRSISKLSGLAGSLPVAAVAFFVGAFALTGIPPLACFWSKMYVLTGALQIHGAFGPIALILVLVESLVSFGWFLFVGQKVFFGTPTKMRVSQPEAEPEVAQLQTAATADPPRSIDWILIVMIVLTIAAPIAGLPMVQWVIR